ncbi:hypothetical protein BWQ95_12550 [Aeromonas hydrophila]|uniref:DUF3696 domain-containing protein n=1 Tax=Aeromonas TaxID=642 RepID=UPI00097D04E9|nr:DUF3696 domain-containing protein [Aeromonas hydrophila]ONG08399.1 hypothetical protein BWQ95_12550 [Aeromonas hydrophila]
MFKSITIENFKSFKDEQKINLAPITLLYGPNSSGKSSIIQMLMLTRETLKSRTLHAAPVFSSDNFDLGSYSTVVHKHDLDKDIHVTIEYNSTIDAQEHILKTSNKPIFGNHDIRKLDLTYSSYEDKNRSIDYLSSLSFSCCQNRSQHELVSFIIKNRKEKRFGLERESTFYIDNDGQDKLRKFIYSRISKTNSSISESQLIRALSEDLNLSPDINLPIYSIFQDGGEHLNYIFSQIFSESKFKLDDIKYLGPLRSPPKRFYSSINDGEKNIALKLSSDNGYLIEKINFWFDKFEIPYTLSVEEIGNSVTGRILSIQLIDRRTETIVTPADVGFGIGQVLPIIIESVVNKNATICVEQPEIHLHPRLQAHLADLFIESIKNKNQWIIETHSEALLLRLQRRIRNKSNEINNESVIVSYVNCDKSGARVTELKMDSDGDFLVHWPDGFFEERLVEQFGK